MINREINKLERCLAECEDQQKAKHEETRTMAGNLADARADLTSMQKENKKIDEAWNKIVASINVKQREYLDVQEDVRLVREKLRELQIGTTNTRRAWNEAKFAGERITHELVRFINEFNRFERTARRKQKQKDELTRRVHMFNKIIGRDKLHIDEFCKLEVKLAKELARVSAHCDGLARKIVKFEHEILEKYQTDYVVNNKGKENEGISHKIRD
uniref:Uncharacterized protein n=1 Tax=Cacopsylla melanoneura TaxID=428564 RepID=A0A8D9AZG4_9HEMI